MDWIAGGHMGFMGLWWVLILAVLITLVGCIALAGHGRGMRNSSAEQRLKERYAGGEIDRETYERMLVDIRK